MADMDVRSIDERLAQIQVPSGAGHVRAPLWAPSETQGHLQVDLYGLAPGGKIDAHYHPHHLELVICWQGSADVTIAERAGQTAQGNPVWGPTCKTLEVQPLDCFLVTRGALHEIVAHGRASSTGLGCGLLVIHPLRGEALTEIPGTFGAQGNQVYRWTKKLAPPNGFDPESSLVPKHQIYDFDPDSKHRAKRVRVWGRDGVLANGDADPAKEDFHLVAYPFSARQENPAHFHPYSVELMLGIAGTTLVYTRDKRWDAKGEPIRGWEALRRPGTLRQGDTALITLGDIHRYVNHTDQQSIVLALQTPQPIMHTLEHETSF